MTAAFERLEVEYVRLDSLVPNPANPRKISPAARDALRRGIERFGLVEPFLARREDRLMIGGHKRREIAEALGYLEGPVVFRAGLSNDEVATLTILLNNQEAAGTWDLDRLRPMLRSLQESGFDATLTGFDAVKVKRFSGWSAEETFAGEEDESIALPLPAEPTSKLGEVYELGNHRLVCGDAEDPAAWEKLLGGVQADVVFTDPPYAVDYVGKTKDALRIQNDALTPERQLQLLRQSLGLASKHSRKGGAWYVCCPHGPAFFPFAQVALELGFWRQTIVWVKDIFVLGHSDMHWKHEAIVAGNTPIEADDEPTSLLYGWALGAGHEWNGGRRQDTVWEFAKPRRSAEHPTMKPVALVQRAIVNSSSVGAVVVDCFGGSGSTLVAAAQVGRRAYLLELDPRYCDVIRARYAALPQTPLGK